MFARRSADSLRRWAFIALGIALFWFVLCFAGLVRPWCIAAGGYGLANGRGGLIIARSNSDIAGSWSKAATWPIWQFLPNQSRILIAPEAAWRPAIISPGTMTVTSLTGIVTSTIRAIWIPMWWFVVIFGFVSWMLFRAVARRRHELSQCDACGYDRAGLLDKPCPECGARGTSAQ